LFKVLTQNKNHNTSAANRLTTTLQRNWSVDVKVLRYTSHKHNMFALIMAIPVLLHMKPCKADPKPITAGDP
jgi:hypothetical protein